MESVFKRTLLAYDGSPAAAAGLSFVRLLARTCGSEVTVAHIHEPGRDPSEESIVDRPPADPTATSTWLADLCGEGFAPGPSATPVVVDAGSPAAAIAELAERREVDLIVVGRSGRHSLGRFLLGSTAERLVRNATGSVAVFPPREVSVASPARVLVGHDGSDRSMEAVRTAAALAGALSAGLLVIHVVDYRVPFAGTPPQSARELIREHGETLLREAADRLSAPLESIETELRSGDPRAALLEAASEHRPLFLVVGARGAGGFAGQVLGSTTDEVVRSAESPVLVVKGGGAR
jgi:nucleotide-binding universal stress UspA family protein